ncbi:MAG: rRNA maturation RNase YbeY [Prevotellaceae bacterium]|jgi:rRNA maturation RNase YbeY|nr:rRNA maturation RNase YbeY [Prevotellaceae bacterium]
MITYQSEDAKLPNISKRQTTNWIKTIAQQYDRKIGDVNYIFCSDEKILEINREYLQHDYYTDIITFDYSEPEVFRPQGEKNDKISGDIFISLDTVTSNAEKFKVSFEQELHRVIIHGILHLCGQKDKSPADRAEMTRKEEDALRQLNHL